MLKIQQYLLSGKTLLDLETEFSITHKRHGKYPNLVLLKYNQIESPMHEKIVQECRGIILDENDNWRIISRAFDKFFNYQESLATEIDWCTAKVQEKLDGSMMVVYSYNGEWLVQSSGSPDASGTVGNQNFTFADLFWQTAKECNLNLPNPNNYWNLCFTFELMTPQNRVVIPHTTNKIVLIGCRDLFDQEEFDSQYIVEYYKLNIPAVQSFPLNSIENIVASFDHINPLSQEGYVVIDSNFNRIKVKHPGYVAIHHAKDGVSDKSLLEIIRNGEIAEVVSYFPNLKETFDNLKEKYDKLVRKIEWNWNVYETLSSKKEFALKIKHFPYSGILFALYDGKIKTVQQGLKEMKIENLMELIK